MTYREGYDKRSDTYYITIYQGGSTVTLLFDSMQQQNAMLVSLENATNYCPENAEV